MMHGTSRAIAVLLAAGAVFAQAPDTRPAYEAASVKPNNSGSASSSSNGSRGQVVFTNQTLKRLIERAYNVKPFQVAGPRWIEDLRFDIAAKYPADMKADDRPRMLRTLLEDRFKLAVHRESKEMPGYALEVAKSGFKLKPVEPGDGGTDSTDGHLTAQKASMAALADFVTNRLGETVVDKTGLAGVYDFELRWTTGDPNLSGRDDRQAALFAAFQEALSPLGLRLQPHKIPVEMVVVDHLERVPIEN
jgi:uncharacterized protein (TIGR03435 family)